MNIDELTKEELRELLSLLLFVYGDDFKGWLSNAVRTYRTARATLDKQQQIENNERA